MTEKSQNQVKIEKNEIYLFLKIIDFLIKRKI
jgi:hypothetical protein